MDPSDTSDVKMTDTVRKLFNDRDLSKPVGKLKAPSKNPPASPPNWLARAKELEKDENKPSPVVTQLDDNETTGFPTGRPLHDEPDYSVCKYCKKPILKSAAVPHIKACLKAKADRTKERKKLKEEKAAAAAREKDGSVAPKREGSPESPEEIKKKPGAKKMAKKDGDGAKGKKRKADEGKLPKEPKAKKKKEKPAKPDPKPKAPVDVEKQCGVQLPNGALCARSLTCKSHSMGAKRSVLGRSQPYDVLLAAYQKKNQAKQQKAAINAGGPPPEELEANAMPVDSDEETELVMAAIARHRPAPFVQPFPMLVRKKSHYIRMRELMASALRPPGQALYGNNDGSAQSGFSSAVNVQKQVAAKQLQQQQQVQQGHGQQPVRRKSSLSVNTVAAQG